MQKPKDIPYTYGTKFLNGTTKDGEWVVVLELKGSVSIENYSVFSRHSTREATRTFVEAVVRQGYKGNVHVFKEEPVQITVGIDVQFKGTQAC